MTQLTEFRKSKDQFFGYDHHSPLTHEQQHHFEGLNYFPENPALKKSVTVEVFPEKQELTIQTSTGDVQTYQRYGRFEFTVDGQTAALTIYSSGEDYFLPFVDGLARKETYGAGRYLDPIPLTKDKFLIDFNYAYNPYCAYNERWSCPLTPAENRIEVPIRAGEKIFEKASLEVE
jgi:hypothetical protein